MLPGSACNEATSPVVRAVSSGGEAGSFQLPRVDWAWGAGVRQSNDCLPIQQAIGAKEYLKRLVQIRELEFVREEEAPGLAQARRNIEAGNQQMHGMMRNTIDKARFLVRYPVNGQATEEWLTGTLLCYDKTVMAVGRQSGCAAFVTREFAPAGKLEAMRPVFEGMQMVVNQPWMDAWTAAMRNRINGLSQKQTQILLEQGRLAQAGRMRQHQDFMSNTQRERTARNDRFKEGQYQKQRNKEEYVDYILDCQRLSNGNARASVGSNCPSRQTGW